MLHPWIAVSVTLHEQPETLAISAALGMDPYAVAGRLIRLWGWIDQHVATVTEAALAPASIDTMLAAPGFAAALLTTRWGAQDAAGRVTFPDLERWIGATARERLLGARRQAIYRANEAAREAARYESNADRNADTVTEPLRYRNGARAPQTEQTDREQPCSKETTTAAVDETRGTVNGRLSVNGNRNGHAPTEPVALLLRIGFDPKTAKALAEIAGSTARVAQAIEAAEKRRRAGNLRRPLAYIRSYIERGMGL